MLFMPEVLTILILNALFLFFSIIAFYLSVKIFLNWDLNSTTSLQYKLEKNSFLTATIIKYIFIIKVPLFIFFIFTLDKISNVLTGAMCAAGVVDATVYGTYLLILKIINIYLFAFWLVLNAQDLKYENQPFTKRKFGFFIFAFFPFIVETVVEVLMFSSINIDKIVSCCGTLYSSSSDSYISNIFEIKTPILLGLFYGSFALMVLFYFLKNNYMYAVLNVFFIIISLVSLIVFFSTYVYELPTHRCPFCLLQKDYYYVGYFLYIFLFLGTFRGLIVGFIKFSKEDTAKSYNHSLLFNSLYVILLSMYPITYYLKNGVWL